MAAILVALASAAPARAQSLSAQTATEPSTAAQSETAIKTPRRATGDEMGRAASEAPASPVAPELAAGSAEDSRALAEGPPAPVEATQAPATPDTAPADHPADEALPRVPTLTRAPELIQFVEARYPEAAMAEKREGDVVLLVDIGADGSVTNAAVVSAAGHGFDEAAVDAVRQFRFSPAELDGAPAAVQIEYVYRFVFRPPPAPAEAIEAASEAEILPVTLRGRLVERATRKAVPLALLRCARLEDGEAGASDGKIQSSQSTDPTASASTASPEASAAMTGAASCGEGLPEEADKDGGFAMRLRPGRYAIEVLSPGHEPFRRVERIQEGEELSVTYHLMPTLGGHFHSVVRGERERREATRRTLMREELQSVPGTMGDAIRVIHNLPGVARSAYLGGQMVVRGASPAETGSYMDGIEIPLLFHFFGGPSVINPEFIDRIDFLPGGFGPRYGRATGGIIDAHTRRGTAEGVHGSFKIDLVDAALFLEAALGEKTSIALAARRSYLDAILAAVTPETDAFGTVSILPRYWDYQLRLDHGRPGDRDSFTVMFFGSDDEVTASTSGGARDLDLDLGGDIGFHRFKASWTRREGAFLNALSTFIGYDETALDTASEGLDSFAARVDRLGVGLRDEATWTLRQGHKARVGLDFKYERTWIGGEAPLSTEYRPLPGGSFLTEPVSLERAYDAFFAGLYHEWEIGLWGGQLTILPGVRFDLAAINGRVNWAIDPRLSARLRVTEGTTLKASLGHYSRMPSVEYLDEDFGNPELGFAKALQAAIGVEQKIWRTLSADVTVFFNQGYDRLASSDEMTARGDGTWKATRYVNAGLSRGYGVEVLVRQEMTSRLFGWLAYTLSRSERKGPDEARYRHSSYDQTHILALLAQYRLGRGWSVGARFRLVSGNPTTPVAGSTFDADSGAYEPITGEWYSERAPVFHQLDLRVDKEWTFERWKLGAYLDIQNVYWADNTEYVLWDYRYRGSTGLSGMPFLPSIGVKGSF